MAIVYPVSSIFPLSVSGLGITRLSNSEVSITMGVARDAFGNNEISITSPLTLNIAASGINGLDTGSVASSTWYAIHAIAESSNLSNVGSLFSLSAVAPTMPAGYDCFRRIGWWYSNASSNLVPATQYLPGIASNIRTFYWTTPVAVLSAGNQTSATAISLITGIPGIYTTLLQAVYTPASNGNTYGVNPTSITGFPSGIGSTANTPNTTNIVVNPSLVSSLPKTYYYVTSGSDSLTLNVLAFDDVI